MAANAALSRDKDPHQVHISLVGSEHMRVSWITQDFDAPSLVEYGILLETTPSSATGESTSYSYFFYRSGDPGQTKWTKSTLEHVKEMEHHVFLLPGDLSYADRSQTLWDSFGQLVEPLARSRAWMVTQGNHEIETIPILMKSAFRAYNARWRMPYEQSGSGGLGRVDRVRTAVDNSVASHTMVQYEHLLIQGEGEAMRKDMEKILYAATVDMVFAGHVHAYERLVEWYRNKGDACGPVHITVGDGGNREGLASKY
ncbi:hypothetical protein KI387_018702, partial [Taxus chinensis]